VTAQMAGMSMDSQVRVFDFTRGMEPCFVPCLNNNDFCLCFSRMMNGKLLEADDEVNTFNFFIQGFCKAKMSLSAEQLIGCLLYLIFNYFLEYD
jgi:hypothetical protein